MNPVRIALICMLCAVGLALRPVSAPIHAQSAAVVVTIQNFSFSPVTTTITAGTTVVWSNKDSVSHTSTSDTGVWDVGVIQSGQSSSGTVFNTPGTYPYHCAIHPDMMGTIVVLGSGSGATSTPPAPPTAAATTVPTSTPVPTLGSTTAAPATATPQPTATNTPSPLFVTLAIGHKTVKAGAKQSIKVKTVSGATISIVVTFPDGAKKRKAANAPTSGTYTWNFKQPGGHTTRTKHTAKVAVTVSDGAASSKKSTKNYRIS